jgi:hypothetical protein
MPAMLTPRLFAMLVVVVKAADAAAKSAAARGKQKAQP